MKKNFSGTLAALALTLAFVGCGDSKQPADKVKGNGLPAAGTTAESAIAYVEIDSLATQYEFCKAELKVLEDKQASLRAQMQSKSQALQNAAANFQKKMQDGSITTEAQAKQEQQRLVRQEQQLQQFSQQAESQMAEAMDAYQKKLRENLDAFLKDYNKDKKYKLILSKSGDNMLYADKSLDITAEVIAGLNKRYKKK